MAYEMRDNSMETNGESSFRFISILIDKKHRSLFERHKKCYRVPHKRSSPVDNYLSLWHKIDLQAKQSCGQNNAKSLLLKRPAVELFYAGCTSFTDRRQVV